VAFEFSFISRSRSTSLPFFISIVAPMRSPAAFITSFSLSASIRTWSLTRTASSIASRSPSVVVLAFTLKATLGVGTSSSTASNVGMLNARVYFPLIVICSRPVFSSNESSTDSSFPALLSSFSSSLTFMHIFIVSLAVYSSKTVFGHSKSIIATRDGSIARSLIASGVMSNVASSMSVEIVAIMSFKNFASAILTLNNDNPPLTLTLNLSAILIFTCFYLAHLSSTQVA